MMRLPVWLVLVAAIAAAAAVIVIGMALVHPAQDLILEAGFAPETITPNADGDADVTIFSYRLSRSAHISIRFTNEDGMTFIFRENEPRIPGEHRVAFSGVVDGYVLEDDLIFGDIARRLIPDGVYTWELTAVDDAGEQEIRSGTLTIRDGDAPLPDITEFTVGPGIFTPNQDGISDRAYINVTIAKDADLAVYLINDDGVRIRIPERFEATRPGEMGRHTFDYDGGLDQNADPPAPGTYTIIATAQDAVGQRVERTAEIRIENSGKPYAQILTQVSGVSVVFETAEWDERYLSERDAPGALVDIPADPQALSLTTVVLPVGDLLIFKVTIENTGDVPIRTTGPEPGTVYQWDQNASTLGWFEEPGAWRIGIDCTTAARDYPWRWAVGNAENLIAEEDPATGATYYYLPPGVRSVIWGAIRMTRIEVYNPQNCWAGLIHEGVSIAEFNNVVGVREIELVALDE
ncbi:hypothetical protein FBR02_01200 [Anaerolineae bacterium CFX9]|nr:hypothetical protein [Anaerolineae bacterium CFX9]